MSKVIIFLKVLKKMGYPNSNIVTLAKFVDYDLNYFLLDLYEEIGSESLQKFIEKGISNFSGSNGVLIDFPQTDEFIYMKIINPKFEPTESEEAIVANVEWGESRILTTDDDGNETYKTIEEWQNTMEMGDWSDYDEFKEYIFNELSHKMYNNLGYGIFVR